MAVTPNGKKLYVTNARSNSVSVIDTATNNVIKTIENVGIEPRGIAITNNGDEDDDDETVYVTQFLALPVAGKVDGQDNSKEAFVTVLSTATDEVIRHCQAEPSGGYRLQGSGRCHRSHTASGGSSTGGLQVHHRCLSQPVKQYWDQRELCLCTQHRVFAQRSVSL